MKFVAPTLHGADLLAHNRARVVLAQPVAGKAVGSEQRERSIPESAALSRSNPGFEGGFAEVGQNTVTIITQRAIDAGSLDPAEAAAELKRLAAEQATGDEAIEARMMAESAARERLRAARG